MGLVIVAAALAPLFLIMRARRFAIAAPQVLLVTIAATLLVTALVLRFALGGVGDDIALALAVFFLGAPMVAVPVAAIAATWQVRAPGYGLAAALMALAGWVIGLVVLLVVGGLSPELHARAGLFAELLIALAIPASYAATCAVYAVALGKRRIP